MVFQLSLTQPTGPDAIPIDVYFGVILPNQSVISWVHDSTPNATVMKMSLGLLPLASNVTVPTTTGSHALAGFQIARHTFTPQDQVGLYVSFCIVVATGKTPYDPRNWLTTGATLFVATP